MDFFSAEERAAAVEQVGVARELALVLDTGLQSLNNGASGEARQAGAEVILGGMALEQVALTLLAAVLVLGMVMVWTLPRQATVPLKQIVLGMRKVVEGERDLTRRLNEERSDEVGDLARGFNSFVSQIHDVICDVRTKVQGIDSSTCRMAAAPAVSRKMRGPRKKRSWC